MILIILSNPIVLIITKFNSCVKNLKKRRRKINVLLFLFKLKSNMYYIIMIETVEQPESVRTVVGERNHKLTKL